MSSHSQLKPAGKLILESLSVACQPILRDYALEIAVLVVGANSKVSGLREVCALAAVLLAVDSLLLCTFLASIFGVMVEVRAFFVSFLPVTWLNHHVSRYNGSRPSAHFHAHDHPLPHP